MAESYLREALDRQETIPQTAALDPRPQAGRAYRLYVLSNMSRRVHRLSAAERDLRPVRRRCGFVRERVVKPEPRIYEVLLERFGLDPAETLFIDDRRSNLEAAAAFGIKTFHFADAETSCARLRGMLLAEE